VANQVKRSALLPYAASALFEIVNDVRSYPEFLPWCKHAEVLEETDRVLTATLSLSGRGIKESFTTRNTLIPDERINLELVSGPFQSLSGYWQFTPLGDSGCRVDLNLTFQFGGMAQVFGGPFTRVFTRAADQLVNAFCTRAQALLD
jgi:ribosome-associated toxin RatA of RatAB toxin-antitoxin module